MDETIQLELGALAELAQVMARDFHGSISEMAERYLATLRRGGTLFFAGNGGSAADAQHVATEYVVRFGLARGALRAVALTTDSSLLTACANDFSFEDVFARQVEALGREGDLLIVHSTSGESPNLVRAVELARKLGLGSVGLLGKGGGVLCNMVDLAIVVPSPVTSHIQEMHLAIEHIVCGLVERALQIPAR